MQDIDTGEDLTHELWLIYCDLKDAETDPDARVLVSSARERLGHLVNVLNRLRVEPKTRRI